MMKPVAETQMATSPWAPSAIIGRKHYKAYVDVLARSQSPVISMTSSSTCSPKHGVQKSPVHRWHTIRQSPCTMPAHPSQDVAGSKSSGSRSSPQLGHLIRPKQPLPHSWLEAVRLHLEAIAIPGVGAATSAAQSGPNDAHSDEALPSMPTYHNFEHFEHHDSSLQSMLTHKQHTTTLPSTQHIQHISFSTVAAVCYSRRSPYSMSSTKYSTT